MKAVQIILVLCLLASFTCFDFATFIFCLIGNSEAANFVTQLINKIIEGENFLSIATFIFSNVGNLVEAVTGCLNK